MQTEAYGKVNLALDILEAREDGYHEMDMIMAGIDLHDTLDIEEAEQDEVLCEQMTLPRENTLTRTLKIMREMYGLKKHYRIRLTKRIPEQAGLGGGSADAAALIVALNQLERLDLTKNAMMEAGARVGADVPFCILGGYARVQGIGERCRSLFTDWEIPVLLVKPEAGVSTPRAFARWDEMEHKAYDIDIVETALRKKDEALLYQTMVNALEPAAMDELPVLEQIKEDMNDCGIVRVMMSGSGSCMMGFCVDEELIDAAAEKLKDKYPFVIKTRIRP